MGTEAGLISGVVSSLLFLAIALLMVRKTPVSVDTIKALTVPEGTLGKRRSEKNRFQ